MAICACHLVLLVSSALTIVAQHLSLSIDPGQSGSPQEQGLRPGPQLEDMPPPDLIESPDRTHDPRPAELNVTVLKSKLGRNLDPEYMSVTRPPETQPLDESRFLFRRNRRGRLVPIGEMPEHLKDMDFKYLRLPDGSKLRTRVTSKLRKKLQQFLWAFTSCPVSYRWKDLGVRFWPRWLKEGHCPTGKTSCSVPPGMKCKPAATVHKTFLRWHCKLAPLDNSALRPQQRHCYWIKVEYPIVTQCTCACPSIYS